MVTIPPFCPNPDCRYHHQEEIPASQRKTWYHKDGMYRTACMPRLIQRFVCTRCGKRFSSRTFSLDYGVKTRVSYRRIFDLLTRGAGIRSIARCLGVTDKVVLNRISRCSRQAVALNALLRRKAPLTEALVADGFESFTASHYYPNNIHLAVGKVSQYLYALDYAHIRRKGRMTDAQTRRRYQLERIWKAPPGDLIRSFTRLLRHIHSSLSPEDTAPLSLYTDEKLEYRRLCAQLPWLIHHTRPSTAPRTLHNDLFAVNYYDREIRKDQSNHVRRTVQFSRDVNNAMDRLWIYGAYHNYVKPYRIGNRVGKACTHAEQAGIPGKEVRALWKYVFTRRFFLSHLHLTESEWYSWYRCYTTPGKYVVSPYPRYAAQ